ncbi:ubiquitin 3 binding protein But2 C-terminal domain-containing protein [Penicillium odoratum]|uniref:ubiquitin 3 binding protein But2 C-terminal domain-containing protein n=1 Tax=Penicillium odoratum TaxID=1167516 RepID=UPI0025489893|nr:ubiquitin 3 binding protein But2 C-terminal domain-containing protein [Penicillium odoratum]KAJ5752255.1 ubiquitin 3 binding protein But2 C-terminal domain-containing protein [Penicillium odoratum]
MKAFTTLATLIASAHALVGRDQTCCFHLTASGGASGGASGEVGQLSDGQNRIGDKSLSPAEFCISSDGSITDSSSRGCILTPPTTQFQCDTGATPTPGFSISSSGLLEFGGSTQFFSCETGDNGGMNIYTMTTSAQSGCSVIELEADSCSSSNSASASSSASSTSSASGSCSTSLSGAFEYPHLIVPINSQSPNQAHGTSFNGEVTSTISSIFNFDIPQSDSGKTCTLVFLFPNKADLETSDYTFSGDGRIDVAQLSEAASSLTTFNNAPSVSKDLGDITVSPGNSYVISSFSCPAGETVAFELKNAGSTDLTFFQDFNPSP